MADQDDGAAGDLDGVFENLDYRLTSIVMESQRLADAAIVRAREAVGDAVTLSNAQAGIVADVHELRIAIIRRLRPPGADSDA